MRVWGKTAAAVIVSAVVNSACHAQVMVDMSSITCGQLLKGTPNSIEAAIWLSGYYNGLSKNTMLNLNQFKKNADAVVRGCAQNRASTVMQVIEKLAAAKK
jgi:hypothetical protein